jgi:hypothetical protein
VGQGRVNVERTSGYNLIMTRGYRTALGPLVVVGMFVCPTTASAAQAQEQAATNAIRDALLWWSEVPHGVAVTDLASAVEKAVGEFRARSKVFQSRLRPPADRAFELQSAFLRKQMLERTAYALGRGAPAASEAALLANSVSPAYEWEGYSGGPLGEMHGADRYVARYPNAAIRAYALLLVAHRSTCALDALRYELANGSGNRTWNLRQQATVRGRFQRALAEAMRSQHPLIRLAAADLERNPRCL